jgi:hypothetical protein
MTEDRVERYVRAAVRGIMEAVLSHAETSEEPQRRTRRTRKSQAETPSIQDMHFPSVSAMENDLFDTPPEGSGDIEMAVAALTRARELEQAASVPSVHPGPGESETGESWRIPQ